MESSSSSSRDEDEGQFRASDFDSLTFLYPIFFLADSLSTWFFTSNHHPSFPLMNTHAHKNMLICSHCSNGWFFDDERQKWKEKKKKINQIRPIQSAQIVSEQLNEAMIRRYFAGANPVSFLQINDEHWVTLMRRMIGSLHNSNHVSFPWSDNFSSSFPLESL